MLDEKEIETNFTKFVDIVSKLEDENLDRLIEEQSTRIATAPANAQKEEYGCFAGGLVSTTLDTLVMMRKLNVATGKQCDPKSLHKCALIHDLGRIGTHSAEYCLPQDSDWHYEKLGLIYKRNQDLYKFNPVQFTLQLLTHYGVKLSEDEFNALISVNLNTPLNQMGRLLLAAKLLTN